MKKLMFAAAAIAASVAIADVTSANIVGYDQGILTNGYTVSTPTFQGINTEDGKVDINSIVPTRTGDTKTIASGAIQIQVLNEFQRVIGTFGWMTSPGDIAYYDLDGEGWADMDEEMPAEKLFESGEGFMVQSGHADAVLTYNGQVLQGATLCKLNNGFTPCGNSTPVAVDINTMVPIRSGDDKAIASGAIQIQILNEFQRVVGTFGWMTSPGDIAYYDLDGEGWADMDEEMPAEKEFAPAEGYMVQSGHADAYLKLPAAIAVGE